MSYDAENETYYAKSGSKVSACSGSTVYAKCGSVVYAKSDSVVYAYSGSVVYAYSGSTVYLMEPGALRYSMGPGVWEIADGENVRVVPVESPEQETVKVPRDELAKLKARIEELEAGR